jgi:hypothetical protein
MSHVLKAQGDALVAAIDGSLKNTPPWKIVLGTAAASLTAAYVYSELTHKVNTTQKPSWSLRNI